MKLIDRIAIERACERLVTSYCHYIDHGSAERVSELFSEGGVWTSEEVRHNGREEIRNAMAERQANASRMSRHVCNNFLIDVIDEDSAEGVVYLTLYRHDGKEGRRLSPLDGPLMVGEYRDRFERGADGWRIVRRDVAVDFLKRESA
jgi:hypothetical protein